jgi:hypothetical protein
MQMQVVVTRTADATAHTTGVRRLETLLYEVAVLVDGEVFTTAAAPDKKTAEDQAALEACWRFRESRWT